MSTPTTGRFVWHDLMATDVEASRDYHEKLLGWSVEEMQIPGMGTYRKLRAGDEEIGGIVPLDEQAGVPPHWIGYVTVDDVDAAATRAGGVGGQACVPPMDIPEVGRFAVLTDPVGAVTSPFRGLHGDPPECEGAPAAGTFCWDELLTSDPEKCASFYAEVYGWTTRETDMGEMGKYVIFGRGEKDAGGMMLMPPDAQGRPGWLAYVAVPDVDASVVTVTELGGTIFIPPTDIPNVGRFTVTADPTGAMLGLIS
ncbi:MAG: VOC family protein [Planctomycetota bacterium]|jgi:predicted enzyme related to lactoylglutathione lyase